MKQKYGIIISDAALSMLDSHVNFMAQANTDAAMNLMNELLDDIESLSEHPERFPAYDNQFIPNNHYRRMLSAKRYLIIYEITDTIVFVDYVVDCRQDYDWLIK